MFHLKISVRLSSGLKSETAWWRYYDISKCRQLLPVDKPAIIEEMSVRIQLCLALVQCDTLRKPEVVLIKGLS